MNSIAQKEIEKSRNNIEKENLICCLDFMIGLKKEQKDNLKQASIEKVRYYYKMKYLEHNDEMLEK